MYPMDGRVGQGPSYESDGSETYRNVSVPDKERSPNGPGRMTPGRFRPLPAPRYDSSVDPDDLHPGTGVLDVESFGTGDGSFGGFSPLLRPPRTGVESGSHSRPSTDIRV